MFLSSPTGLVLYGFLKESGPSPIAIVLGIFSGAITFRLLTRLKAIESMDAVTGVVVSTRVAIFTFSQLRKRESPRAGANDRQIFFARLFDQ